MSVGLILNLLNELKKKYIMRASGEHNINLFNEFNKLSNEPAQIFHSIYHISPKRTLNCKKISFHRHAYNVTLMFSTLLTLCLYIA